MTSPAGIEPLRASPPDLSPGQRFPELSVGPLSRTDFVWYAGAGGDFNPIHHDETFAQAAGLPSVFGMGMLHAGMLGTWLAHWVGPNNIRTFGVRFGGQVWPGDVLTFGAEVSGVRESDGDGRSAEVSLEITRQTGESVLLGTAIVGLG